MHVVDANGTSAEAQICAALTASIPTPIEHCLNEIAMNAHDSQKLRADALRLLQQAQLMDSMGPYLVTHTHAGGFDSYILWACGLPTIQEAIDQLPLIFEPELGETVVIQPSFALEDFTCMYPNRMLLPDHDLEGDADDDPGVSDRPRG